MKERIKELGKRAKMGNMTWKQVAEKINTEYNENLSAEAVRKRFDRMPYKTENTKAENISNEYETQYSDGTIEAQKIIEYNKEIFGDKNKLLDYLGYNHNEWEFTYITTSTWLQHTKEQTTKQMYAVKFKVKPLIKSELDLEQYVEIAKQVFSEEIKPIDKPNEKKHKISRNVNKLMLIPQIEAHLGKLSNEIETGTNYDHHIVEERVKKYLKRQYRYKKENSVGNVC